MTGLDLQVFGRNRVDFQSPDDVYETAAALNVDTVINAVAYTAVDRAEEEQDQANTINGTSVKALAQACAVTGLYFLDGTAPARAREIKPSGRGELEIISLLQSYLGDGQLTVEHMGWGFAWLDTGTHGSLLDEAQLRARAKMFGKSDYGRYLLGLL